MLLGDDVASSNFRAFGLDETGGRSNEREQDVGIDALSEEDHPSVVILNGLHLEYEQYVYLSLYLWIDIDSYVGGDLQRISKHWGCIQCPSKWPSWLNIRTVCVIVLQIGLQSRNGTCWRHACCNSRMQSIIRMACILQTPEHTPHSILLQLLNRLQQPELCTYEL